MGFEWTIWDTVLVIAGTCALLSLTFRWLATRGQPRTPEQLAAARARRKRIALWAAMYVLPSAALIGLIMYSVSLIS